MMEGIMTAQPWESSDLDRKNRLMILVGLALYAAWNVVALLWRVPELILAKKELAEAQKLYYEAKAEAINKLNTPE